MESNIIANIFMFEQECTFNKLKDLQMLVKKELFLKEESKYKILIITLYD